MGMSKTAWILLVVLVLGVLGGFGYYKTSERARISGEAKDAAYVLVKSRVGLAGEEAYVEGLIDVCHQEAFGEAFNGGGFTNQSFYDEEVYLDELWTRVAKRARDDGRPEIAGALPHFAEHRQELEQQRSAPVGDGAT